MHLITLILKFYIKKHYIIYRYQAKRKCLQLDRKKIILYKISLTEILETHLWLL